MRRAHTDRHCLDCGEPVAYPQFRCEPHRIAAGRRAADERRARKNGEAAVLTADPVAVKTCGCGVTFPVEYNSRGQATSRKHCDDCRVHRAMRISADLAAVPADASRCAECDALVGLQYGTVSHLDEHGRCPACARWAEKARRRQVESPPAPAPPAEASSGAVDGPALAPVPEATNASAAESWPSVLAAIAAVEAANGVQAGAILGGSHQAEISALRFGVWRAMRSARWSYCQIGRAFGRSHSTVIRGAMSRHADVLAAERIATPLITLVGDAEAWRDRRGKCAPDEAALWVRRRGGVVDWRVFADAWSLSPQRAQMKLRRVGLWSNGRGLYVTPEAARRRGIKIRKLPHDRRLKERSA